MSNYTIDDIKELREKTQAGLKDVKAALEEADGDKEKALEIIRVKGKKSLAKREGRTAGNGLVAAQVIDGDSGQIGYLVQVNAETDFVVKNDQFVTMAQTVLQACVDADASDLESLLKAETKDGTVQDTVDALAAIVGEKLEVVSVSRVTGEIVESYLHRSSMDLPPTLGVLVSGDKASAGVLHDIALHIAASAPSYLDRTQVPAEIIEKERVTLEEITRSEGKPEAALPKIMEGRMNAFFKEIALVDQPFVKDAKKSVGQLLEEVKGQVTSFVRVAVGA